jgi:hypothetical protein
MDKIDETVESKEMFKLKAMVLVAGKKNQEKQARLPHSPLENISVFYSLIAISFCSMPCHVGEDCTFRFGENIMCALFNLFEMLMIVLPTNICSLLGI